VVSASGASHGRTAEPVTVGLVANPVSARDIRRVVANAGSLQSTDRANLILRALSALGACGVERVLAMPDRKGVQVLLERGLARERNTGRWLPDVEFLDLPVTGTVVDSIAAADVLAAKGVAAILVLGGDGTHRAVVSACCDVPIAGLSTGTNNAYPELREPTITGLATGLYATGALEPDEALAANKLLEVDVNDGDRREIALVDVVVSTERFIGARALWHTGQLRELFVSFADPEAIGMSAIAGLLEPVGRRQARGLHVTLAGARKVAKRTVVAPIAPGLVEPVGILGWQHLQPGVPVTVDCTDGVIALDGERELEIDAGDVVTVTLRTDAFRSIDVARCMAVAAERGLFRDGTASAWIEQRHIRGDP
jgi:predicted polyphosphate/ATP-dependent NAD kinase